MEEEKAFLVFSAGKIDELVEKNSSESFERSKKLSMLYNEAEKLKEAIEKEQKALLRILIKNKFKFI